MIGNLGEGTLSECADKKVRSGQSFWAERVAEVGNHKSPFLDTPQEKIDTFTELHNEWIRAYCTRSDMVVGSGKDVLEICCGYGRNMMAFRDVKSYIGIDFVPELIEEAKQRASDENLYEFHFDFRVMSVRDIPKEWNEKFDLVVAVAAVTSLEHEWAKVLASLKATLKKPGQPILWLEEEWMRMDFK
jgi:SAM-dependent methyltransferase